jgi:predicted membrane-bound spermidine synthase
MSAVLHLVFFVSGAAALLFETLWFRLAGLAFGNSVWASSLVLAAFMGGLALGNALAARHGGRVQRPVRLYASLEAAIAVTGLGLVLLLPALAHLLAPLFRPLVERPWLLNPLRLLVAFVLMLVPTTAMGATLPLLVRALSARESDFGRVLGRLYGWNTLGAVAGALAGEGLLIGWLGLRGTGVAAAALNLLAAAAALSLSRALLPLPEAGAAGPDRRLPRAARPILAAAFLCGGILLALEVVWFRFVLLFVMATSLAFAVMLAVVLAGISLGGFAATLWLRLRPAAYRYFALVALASGCLSVLAYASFDQVFVGHGNRTILEARGVAEAALRLMFAVSFLSGMLFTLIGKALNAEVAEETRTTGILTLANTVGGMTGSLLAGFVLLPLLGVERCFFLLAAAYGVVALCGRRLASAPGAAARAWWLAAAAFAAFLAAFPFGLMQNHFFKLIATRFGTDTRSIAASREGLSETVMYLRFDDWERPHHYQLVTNGYSMSASHSYAKRYMKQYVYLPMALRPDASSALLICFGVGSTAKALTDTARLRSIDVVDISRDILSLAGTVFPTPAANPLNDPRVHKHVEDGRFFLQTTRRRFDLITAEPPPPKVAGVVNLYSREYFQLVHERLSEGGMATYWLPVSQLEVHETKAIIHGFCDVFSDCSLWTGMTWELMLMGSRGQAPSVTDEQLARQWRDPAVLPELKALGFESPENLASTFLGDAPFLASYAGGQPPLVDDRPARLGPRLPQKLPPEYPELLDAAEARERFEHSAFIRRLWPEGSRSRALGAFDRQVIFNRQLTAILKPTVHRFTDLPAVVSGPDRSRALALWMMQSDSDEQRLAADARSRGVVDAGLDYKLGLGALAGSEFERASEELRRAESRDTNLPYIGRYRLLALCLAGRNGEAAAAAPQVRARETNPDPEFWDWLRDTCPATAGGATTTNG